MTIKNFTELPGDKYNNRGYTVKKPCVIQARVGETRLHVIAPKWFKETWPKLIPNGWIVVDHPAGFITQEK